MDRASLSSASLRSVIGLIEKREKLLAEFATIEGQITKLLGDGYFPWNVAGKSRPEPKTKSASLATAPKAKKARKSGRRAAMKALLVPELEAAGKAGVAVKDLATKLALKAQNIHAWIHTTGKKLGVKRIGPGKYAL